mgnify:CR=1 FL=1
MSIISLNAGTVSHFLPEGRDVQGAVNLNGLQDVTIVSLQDGQILKYNSSTGQFENTDVDLLVSEVDGGTY